MGSVRVTVVSDSHLSERTPEASGNWRAAVDHIAATAPDLVVHAGDISADGARLPADLDFARRHLDEIERAGARVLAVPGNHDVGENPFGVDGVENDGYPLVDADRLARYRDAVGPDRWIVDIGDWRLVGLETPSCSAPASRTRATSGPGWRRSWRPRRRGRTTSRCSSTSR